MRKFVNLAAITLLALGLSWAAAPAAGNAVRTAWTLVGWNNLGMHCMDADYSVFSILPPFNTIHAQLIDPSGLLVTNPAARGVTVTYQGVADPALSINRTSAGKTNFWDWVKPLYGAAVPVDMGLAGHAMPGTSNVPQPLDFDPASGWFIATGIPITPIDDAYAANPYPLMHLVAKDTAGNVLATTDIVLPVSAEMDCRACHSSGSAPAARPTRGWAWDADGQRDYRLNILLAHDDRQLGDGVYATTLAAAGYSSRGLYATVASNGTPVLCAACHLSDPLLLVLAGHLPVTVTTPLLASNATLVFFSPPSSSTRFFNRVSIPESRSSAVSACPPATVTSFATCAPLAIACFTTSPARCRSPSLVTVPVR